MALGGFRGVWKFPFCRELISGTVWMVLGGFGGVRQISFVGVDLGHSAIWVKTPMEVHQLDHCCGFFCLRVPIQ